MGRVQRQPKWFTAPRLLMIFSLVNLAVYCDRGLIASNGVNGSPRSEANPRGTGIQGEFDLTYFQDGLLPTAFMVGLLLSSPVFAEVCKHYSGFRLLGIGMGVWAVACALCGLAPNFASLMLARMFVGVGEASFVALAAPFIDDYAPPKSKTQWFAIFYLCIPVGFALGYILGGLVAPVLGWRWAFGIEAAAMIPFVLFTALAQPLQLHGTDDDLPPNKAEQLESGEVEQNEEALLLEGGDATGASDQEAPGVAVVGEEDPRAAADSTGSDGSIKHAASPSKQKGVGWSHHVSAFLRDVRCVVSQPVWVTVCLAYTQYVAVLGVYAYWGPKAGHDLFFADDGAGSETDLVFGGVTVITGVVGSLAGGILLDRMGSSLRNANLLCACATLVGVVLLLPAFLATKSFTAFIVVFALGQLAIFTLQAPVAAIQMWCVPTSLRPLGASLTTMSIHVFGDVPSPPLLGWLQSTLSQGKTGQEAAEQWRFSMSCLTLLLVCAGLLFLRAAHQSTPSADFRKRQGNGAGG